MNDSIAIVTGASGNTGLAVIKKFLAEGYRVFGTVMKNDPVNLNLTDSLFEKVAVDLDDENETRQFVTTVIRRYGRIDAVVLTVGGFAMGSITNTGTSDILQQYKLNFETAYNIARPVFTQMMQQSGGRIFFIGSRPGLSAEQGNGMVAYSLSKSLIFRLAALMNVEAKGLNIVASVVIPSTIDTPQNRKNIPGADPAKWVKADSIADIIYFYCSDEASAIREPLIKVYNNA